MHQLEAQLAMAKDFAAELRSNLMELEDHCCMLDEVQLVDTYLPGYISINADPREDP